VIAAALLLAGYGALLLWVLLKLREGATGAPPPPIPPALSTLLSVNAALLGWRLTFRFAFTARAYGLAEGLRAVPRALVGNYIAIMAAWVALTRYRTFRRTGQTRWHKTAHAFPTELPAE
jgi:adsorption protein B